MSDFTNYYNELDSDINNISKWFPLIKECGIRVPKTIIKKVPEEVAESFFMERQGDEETVLKWVKNIIPEIREVQNGPFVFMKNGGFSDKFNAANCITTLNPLELTQKMIELNYDALMLGANGITEMAFREFIPHDESITNSIYNGLALRTEYRVFYDFDNHKVLYSSNYWDWDYCHDAICRNANDKLVYEKMYSIISSEYSINRKKVESIVNNKMQKVTGLKGAWSVDIMQDECKELWLIDMAIAQQSAYWDINKASESEVNQND